MAGQFKALATIGKMREAYGEFGLAPPDFRHRGRTGKLEADRRSRESDAQHLGMGLASRPESRGECVGSTLSGEAPRNRVSGRPDDGPDEPPRRGIDNCRWRVAAESASSIRLQGTQSRRQAESRCHDPPGTLVAGRQDSGFQPGQRRAKRRAKPTRRIQRAKNSTMPFSSSKEKPGTSPIHVTGASADGPSRGWIRVPDENDDGTTPIRSHPTSRF